MNAPDHARTIGMSVSFLRDDLETAARTIAELGFDALEVHGRHLESGMPGVRVSEAHAQAAGELIRRHGLIVSSLNVVGAEGFEPHGGPGALDHTIHLTAEHLRWAAAMGAPRILVWDGRMSDPAGALEACRVLAHCFGAARRESGLADPPAISVELHPFTFGLALRRLPELAAALLDVGAGICLDLCHFGVALGAQFADSIEGLVLDAVNEVHFADTDLVTSEFHMPPGDGRVDFDAIASLLVGRRLPVAWDLFGWPSPRHAMATRMERYRAFVAAHDAAGAGLGTV